MAIGSPYTVVNSGETVSTATTTFGPTVTSNTSIGDCIVVVVLNSNTTVSGVADSQGNSYTLAKSDTATSIKSYIFTCQGAVHALASGVDTITATFGSTASTTTRITIFARGCSGITASGAVDANGTANNDSNAGSTSPAITGTTTLSVTAEWLVAGLFTASTGGTPSAWSDSFVSAGTNNGGGGTALLTVADEVVSAKTAQAAAATIVSAKWVIIQVALTASQIAATATGAITLAATSTGTPNFGKKAIGSASLAAVLTAADLID